MGRNLLIEEQETKKSQWEEKKKEREREREREGGRERERERCLQDVSTLVGYEH